MTQTIQPELLSTSILNDRVLDLADEINAILAGGGMVSDESYAHYNLFYDELSYRFHKAFFDELDVNIKVAPAAGARIPCK